MRPSSFLARLGVLALFFGLVAWAIWSETRSFEPLAAAATGPRLPGAPDDDWRTSGIWDDGLAEFCVYEATWRRYGELFPGRVALIAVKEPWAPELDVKADVPRADGFDVLKLNHVRDVRTGIYEYHQMASVFVDRASGTVRKIAATSSEDCGISTAQMTDGLVVGHSYFDGRADWTAPYPAGALPEDGLPLLLRDYLRGDPPARLDVFPSLMAGRHPEAEVASYRVTRREGVRLELPVGERQGVEIRLESTGGETSLRYVFDPESPHPLLLFAASTGTEYRLARCGRIAYWEMHQPGGESWLPESLR